MPKRFKPNPKRSSHTKTSLSLEVLHDKFDFIRIYKGTFLEDNDLIQKKTSLQHK